MLQRAHIYIIHACKPTRTSVSILWHNHREQIHTHSTHLVVCQSWWELARDDDTKWNEIVRRCCVVQCSDAVHVYVFVHECGGEPLRRRVLHHSNPNCTAPRAMILVSFVFSQQQKHFICFSYMKIRTHVLCIKCVMPLHNHNRENYVLILARGSYELSDVCLRYTQIRADNFSHCVGVVLLLLLLLCYSLLTSAQLKRICMLAGCT